MIFTKKFYSNPTTQVSKSLEDLFDFRFDYQIPWTDVTTAGWQNTPDQIKMWGTDNKLVMRDDPEFFAPNDLIRSDIIPSININDPIYQFERSQFVYTLY